MGIVNPRILPKTFTGHGHQVTVNEDRTIQVKPGDWLSKYTMAIWGDARKRTSTLSWSGARATGAISTIRT